MVVFIPIAGVGDRFLALLEKNVARWFGCFIQEYHLKLILSDSIYEKTEYFFFF